MSGTVLGTKQTIRFVRMNADNIVSCYMLDNTVFFKKGSNIKVEDYELNFWETVLRFFTKFEIRKLYVNDFSKIFSNLGNDTKITKIGSYYMVSIQKPDVSFIL